MIKNLKFYHFLVGHKHNFWVFGFLVIYLILKTIISEDSKLRLYFFWELTSFEMKSIGPSAGPWIMNVFLVTPLAVIQRAVMVWKLHCVIAGMRYFRCFLQEEVQCNVKSSPCMMWLNQGLKPLQEIYSYYR